MATMKRILSIELKHITDTDADTSDLGTYASRPSGDYSINRKHEVTCNLNNEQVDSESFLSDVDGYLLRELSKLADGEDELRNLYYKSLEDARDIIDAASEDDELGCDCGGVSLERHSYEYFNTSGNYVGLSAEDIRDYTIQDYKRAESYNDMEWCYIGIKAEAKIQIGETVQKITSGGLWGIESDSDQAHFAEVEGEELSQLRTTLYEMGFSKRAIVAAVKESVK
jgi:hypothetical protein